MRPTDIVLRVAPDGTASVHMNGSRVDVKSVALVATAGEGCDVTLTIANCAVNQDSAGPDAPSVDTERPPVGAVFQTLCHGCGKLFRNGDGHVCS